MLRRIGDRGQQVGLVNALLRLNSFYIVTMTSTMTSTMIIVKLSSFTLDAMLYTLQFVLVVMISWRKTINLEIETHALSALGY